MFFPKAIPKKKIYRCLFDASKAGLHVKIVQRNKPESVNRSGGKNSGRCIIIMLDHSLDPTLDLAHFARRGKSAHILSSHPGEL